jgi:PAS domain S-box-containing protein
VPKLRRLRGAVWQGIGLIVLPALVLVGLQIYGATGIVPASWRGQELVAHTLQVIATARALDQSVSEAERGEFGYVVTAAKPYLDIYAGAARQVTQRLKRLHDLTTDNPEQTRRIALLSSAIDQKLAELQSAVDARQKLGLAPAFRTVETNLKPDTRRVISGLVGLLIASEDRLLAAREAKIATLEDRAERVNVVGITLTVALMLLGALILGGALRRDSLSVARLRESEERFRVLVSGVRDYAIFMLDPGGRVVSWNEGARRIKGYDPGQAIGLHLSAFRPAEEGDPHARADEVLAAAEREGSVKSEGWRVRKDGSRFYANTLTTALWADDGSLRGFAEVTRDVTERRAHEAALEESRAALAQAQKMEALGQLTGGLAHDFNNLLAVIIGGIEFVQLHPANEPKNTQMLDAARQAAQQGAQLVRRMLAFSRRQALEPQTIDVNALVRDMAALLERTLGENIRLEMNLDPVLWLTRVDRNQLETALVNLCVNARDAMPGEGELTVLTRNDGPETGDSNRQRVLIAVSDTGEGMPAETIRHAFEPFYTTKPEGKGTGLGLSQVHGFVKRFGGTVAIESEEGRGSTVKLFLPRHALSENRGKRDLEQTGSVSAR